jgi:apolipoprotein N-acyltransferase
VRSLIAAQRARSFNWPQLSAPGAGLRCLLAALAGLLLFLPCVDARFFPTGWIAFLPLLIAIEGRSPRQSYLLGALAGTVFWAGTTYWLGSFVTALKGYPPPYNHLAAAGFWLYAGQSLGISTMVLQWVRERLGISVVFAFPVVFVTIFSLYPMMWGVRIGEGQSAFLPALQAVDITGANGLDFMLAMTGAAIYAAIAGRRQASDASALGMAGVLLLGWFGYGYYSLYHWDGEIAGWSTKRIGIVQPDDRPSVEVPKLPRGYSWMHPPEMEMTKRLAERGAELVVWPEARFKGYFYYDAVRQAYRQSLREAGTALLFHDVEPGAGAAGSGDYNSAGLIGADGELVGSYRKIKRFPFGEYLPVVGEVPVLRALVTQVFGEFLREMGAGEAHQVLAAAGLRVVPKICYESAFPAFVADALADDPRGAVLVVMSQDGWFGDSAQPFQHLRGSSVRAVENRVPLVHAINGGPSGVVLPSGRIAFQTTPYVRSESVVDIPYSATNGGSFYTQYPRLFIYSVYAAFGLLVVLALLRRRRTAAVAVAEASGAPAAFSD